MNHGTELSSETKSKKSQNPKIPKFSKFQNFQNSKIFKISRTLSDTQFGKPNMPKIIIELFPGGEEAPSQTPWMRIVH